MKGVIVLSVAAATLTGCGGSDEKALDKAGAGLVCEDFVDDRLKSPGSAEFSAQRIDVIDPEKGRYDVTGVVDAENSFGALLRSNYRCELRLDGEKWHLLNPGSAVEG